MLYFIIQLIFLGVGVISFLVYFKREDPIMLGASLFLIIASVFFQTMINLERIRDHENTLEVYHNAYMELVKKKK